MFTKNYFVVFFVSLFVAGFIFFALQDKAYSQPPTDPPPQFGCCQNQSSGACVSGNNGDPINCPPNFYFPDVEFCVGGPQRPACGPAGCCVIAPGDCEDVPPASSSCSDFRENLHCEEIDECQPVTGCCVSAGPTCEIAEDSSACDVDWQANTPCDDATGACATTGPTGCCSSSNGTTTCLNDQTAGDCDSSGDTFVEGESCNILNTCGQLGCCQFADTQYFTSLSPPDPGASCDESNFTTCERGGGRWIADDICNTSGVCESLSIGCCVFAPNDCFETSEGSCREQGGSFEGQDVLCSEVRICNVVISPIPTLNQWGLIAVAGLMGLFSLFIIIRRHRYNLS